MMKDDIFDELENLPSLKEGWVRLVHRCIADGRIDNIKENGLIFNKRAAGLPWNVRGGNYDGPGYMTTPHNEESFWLEMQRDDMGNFNDNKSADAKIIFDIPLDEYLLLELYGRKFWGKVDSKYFVGCVKNVNGWNKKLKLPVMEVKRAERKSRNNPSSKAVPNDVEKMICECAESLSNSNVLILKNMIKTRMLFEKENFEYDLNYCIEMHKLEDKTGLTPVEIRKLPKEEKEKIIAQFDAEYNNGFADDMAIRAKFDFKGR